MSETFVNFLGGSPLNRLSWLRTSTPFLSAVLSSESTRWVLFNAGQPLVRNHSATKTRSLALLPTTTVLSLLGPLPVFGQGKEPGESAPHVETGEHDDHHNPAAALTAARFHGSPAVFLGLHEPPNAQPALPSSDFSAKADPQIVARNIEGTPYFALDVTDGPEEALHALLVKGSEDEEGSLEFAEPRSAASSFSAFEAAVFAEGRSMIDWNLRNKFCPACGSPTYSLWAGWKLACTSLLPWADNSDRKPCPSSKGIHNFSHPRTDPVVIMAVIDTSGERILLGRNRKFPNGFYSTLAGFVEPGESFEDAVKREIWEEAGVRVWGVTYHSGQPWPYPANLMVGFYAYADASQPIRIDLDNELVDARWCTRAEILEVLAHPSGVRITRNDYKKFDDDNEPKRTEASKEAEQLSSSTTFNSAPASHTPLAPADPSSQTKDVPESRNDAKTEASQTLSFRVPPRTAIAGVLISDWANGKIGLGEGSREDAIAKDPEEC